MWLARIEDVGQQLSVPDLAGAAAAGRQSRKRETATAEYGQETFVSWPGFAFEHVVEGLGDIRDRMPEAPGFADVPQRGDRGAEAFCRARRGSGGARSVVAGVCGECSADADAGECKPRPGRGPTDAGDDD